MIIYHVIWGHINELIILNIKNRVSYETYYELFSATSGHIELFDGTNNYNY